MKGLIIRLIGGEYTVVDQDHKTRYICKPRGLFRLQGISPKVGDYVDYEPIDDKRAIITDIAKRYNDLIRPSISNIEQGFIVFSVKEPELNLNLLDRFLVIFEYNNILPIIVFNKWDLLGSKQEQEIQKVMEYYQQIGYICLKTSAKLKLLDILESYIENHISVITGQSGVGKSSILNVLDPDLELITNEISLALNRGKHTTRHVELIYLKNGWLADTPGFGNLEFTGLEDVDIAHSFKEFFKYSSKCRYKGCLHLNEPKCEIKLQLKEGTILPSRYENYCSFIEEVKKQRKW